MEPLTALSLAGTIVQFVQFATSLFNGARTIHASASGASENSQSIEIIYRELSNFSSNLQIQEQQDGGDAAHSAAKPSRHDAELRSMAAGCQADCAKLLEISSKLNVKTKSGPGWFKSFHVAFTEISKSGEIRELKQRIGDYQRMIVVLFCATSK